MEKRPDDKIESFHLWANADSDRRAPKGFPAAIVLASAAVTVVLGLVYLARAVL
jgi:hypothetical protein